MCVLLWTFFLDELPSCSCCVCVRFLPLLLPTPVVSRYCFNISVFPTRSYLFSTIFCLNWNVHRHFIVSILTEERQSGASAFILIRVERRKKKNDASRNVSRRLMKTTSHSASLDRLFPVPFTTSLTSSMELERHWQRAGVGEKNSRIHTVRTLRICCWKSNVNVCLELEEIYTFWRDKGRMRAREKRHFIPVSWRSFVTPLLFVLFLHVSGECVQS